MNIAIQNWRQREKMYLLRIICVMVGLVMLGCGAAPGGDSLDGANSDLGLPVSGAAAKVQQGWTTFKDGGFSTSKELFNQVIGSGDATNLELADAYAGMGWAEVKLNGSNSGIPSFRNALSKNAKQEDALVGLAGALVSKGDRTSIDEAVSLLEGLGDGGGTFTYFDEYNVGVSNAEAHALLAYGYFVQGNRSKADQQIAIARDLDSQFSGTPVDQIDDILSFIP